MPANTVGKVWCPYLGRYYGFLWECPDPQMCKPNYANIKGEPICVIGEYGDRPERETLQQSIFIATPTGDVDGSMLLAT